MPVLLPAGTHCWHPLCRRPDKSNSTGIRFNSLHGIDMNQFTCWIDHFQLYLGPCVSQQVHVLSSARWLRLLQTWSSRDLSLGLETRFYKSWSRSWSWNLGVLVSVLVLEPRSLGLGLGTLQSRSRSWSWSLLVRQIQTLGLKWHAVTRTKCCIHC